MIKKKDITGIILAGGKSSRMGTDKGLLKLNETYFVAHSIEALKPLVTEIMIVSNNSDYDQFNLKRISDLIKNAGPLAGIYTGLYHSRTNYNLVLSCDIPLIKTAILEQLIAAQDEDFDIIQIVSQGKPMPLIALYNKRCEAQFHQLLLNDERRIHVALKEFNVKNIALSEEQEIYTTNINTSEELKIIAHGDKN